MATKIGHKDIMRLKDHYSGLQRRMEGVRKKGESVVGELVSAAEVSASAFAFGAVQGKYGSVDVLGVPADLASAIVLHLAGFAGLAGKASEHLHAFGDGALASFFFTLGRGVGVNWKKNTPAISGEEASKLTQADLDALTGKRGA